MSRGFRLLLAGQTVSLFGDAFHVVALPWLVFRDGGDARALGAVLTAYGLCRLLTTLIGGTLSDRFGARAVMLVADAGRAGLTVVLAVTAARGQPELSVLCLLAGGLGLFSGIFLPASMAMVPTVLPPERLRSGNALLTTSGHAAGLVGPAVAGAVVAGATLPLAFAIDAASFVVSAACLLGIPGAVHSRPSTVESRESLWRFLVREPLVRTVVAVTAVVALTVGGMTRIGLPALAHDTLAAGARGFGLLLAGFSAGALVAGLVLAAAPPVRRSGALAMCSGMTVGLATAAVPVAGFAGALVALVVAGAATTVTNVLVTTLVQQATPAWLLGRMMGVIMFASLGLFPVSVAGASLVVDRWGVSTVFVGTGVMLLLAFGAGLRRLWPITVSGKRQPTREPAFDGPEGVMAGRDQ